MTERWLTHPPEEESEARVARALALYADDTRDVRPSEAVRARLARDRIPRRRARRPGVLLAAAVVLVAGVAAAAATVPWLRGPWLRGGEEARPTPAPMPSDSGPKPLRGSAALPASSASPEPSAQAAPEPERGPETSHSATPRDVPSGRPSALEGESAALARAVAALRRDHAPDRALALLDAYRSEYPRGALSLEASVVRVDALLAAGRRREALAVLERLPLDRMPRGAELRKLRDQLQSGR